MSLVLENGLREYYTCPASAGGCGLGPFTRGRVELHRLRIVPARPPTDSQPGAVPGPTIRVFPSFEDFRRFFIGRYLPQALDPSGMGGRPAEFVYHMKQVFTCRFINLKVMLRLASADDRDFLGASMNFNGRQNPFVANLRPGQFVVFEERLDQPVLLHLPDEGRWQALGLLGQGHQRAEAHHP